jgi:transcriptional regulator with XRE-family HTH domain
MEYKIGEKIAVYRKAKGLTQEALGKLVGVSGQAVSKWENGGVPDTYLLPSVAKVLGVSIDALFGVERKISDYSVNEILDAIFEFYSENIGETDIFQFMFETFWTLQSAYFGNENRIPLNEVIEKYRTNPQITSQIINNKGTTYLSLVKDLQFFCAVRDTEEISKMLLAEGRFCEFFHLLASEGGFGAVIFTQSTTETGQYTAEILAEKIGISLESFLEIEPLLIKYGLLNEDTLTINDKVIKVYRKQSNPEIRPILIMAYQFINTRQCYYNFTCNRTKPYF